MNSSRVIFELKNCIKYFKLNSMFFYINLYHAILRPFGVKSIQKIFQEYFVKLENSKILYEKDGMKFTKLENKKYCLEFSMENNI